MIDCVRAGIEKNFEVDYERLMTTTVPIHDTVVSGYEDLGIKICCERPGRSNCAVRFWIGQPTITKAVFYVIDLSMVPAEEPLEISSIGSSSDL